MSIRGTKHLEGAFRFVLWAQALHRLPSVAEICAHWGCSRATAYRYRTALADARGEFVPKHAPGETLPMDHRNNKPARGGFMSFYKKAA